MVDCFLLLTLARTGDQLQGIKKGVLELADVIAVNKADGDHELDARKAARELAGALRLLRGPDAWTPPVLTCSGLTGAGLDEVWEQVRRHHDALSASGELAAKRRRQQVDWTWTMVRETLLTRLSEHPGVRALTPSLEQEVADGTLTPTLAAERILKEFSTESTSGRCPSWRLLRHQALLGHARRVVGGRRDRPAGGALAGDRGAAGLRAPLGVRQHPRPRAEYSHSTRPTVGPSRRSHRAGGGLPTVAVPRLAALFAQGQPDDVLLGLLAGLRTPVGHGHGAGRLRAARAGAAGRVGGRWRLAARLAGHPLADCRSRRCLARPGCR